LNPEGIIINSECPESEAFRQGFKVHLILAYIRSVSSHLLPPDLKPWSISGNMAKVKLTVVIVGAGLGGLAAAIGIARAGHQVIVLEQAAILSEVRPIQPY
jgi:NADPH-dependent 2,4-dienoyl-CoA reductase/sulfur reductase-like enzyme